MIETKPDPTPISDLIDSAGGGALNDDPEAVESFLTKARPIYDAETSPIRKALFCGEVRKRLKAAKVTDPAGLVRAAFGAGALADDGDEAGGADGPAGSSVLDMMVTPEPWPDPVDGAAVLDEVEAVLAAHVVLPEHTAPAVALWTLWTYVYTAFAVAPILNVYSPEKGCGKSTLLTCLYYLAHRPVKCANLSPAVLFRVVEKYGPTLLLDEADAWMKENEELRGLLNAGHTPSDKVLRIVGEELEPRAFSVFGPKAIAGIGQRADTITDRSITVPLRRRAPDEPVQRVRIDRMEDGALHPLRRRLARWAEDHRASLRGVDPAVPASLADRAADNWRPLLALADAVGEAWPKRAREAAERLSAVASADLSTGPQLLDDIREIFRTSGDPDYLHSHHIVARLHAMDERPWSDWHGRPLTAQKLAVLLKKYQTAKGEPIQAAQKRIGLENAKAYARASFVDAWSRYLPAPVDAMEARHAAHASAKSNGTNPARSIVLRDVAGLLEATP